MKEVEYELEPQDIYENFGFLFAEKYDVSQGKWINKQIDNNYIVGKILDPVLAKDIKSGDKIISLNGKDFDFNKEQTDIISNADSAEFEFLTNQGNTVKKDLVKDEYYTHSPMIDINSINFNKIDTKSGSIEVNLEFDVSSNYIAEYHDDLWNALQGSYL